MIPPPKPIDAITLFVEDLDAAKRFYQKVFGLPVVFEDPHSAVFKFQNLLINLLTSEAAIELVEPAIPGRAETGPRFQLTVPVDDVDAICARLTSAGIRLVNGPMNRPWGVRTACFKDPGGHLWEIAQPI